MSRLLLLSLLLVGQTKDERLADERQELEEKLSNEQALLESLKSDKTDVMAVLDKLSQRYRTSQERATSLAEVAHSVAQRKAVLEAQQDETQKRIDQEQLALEPQLSTLYRLSRQDKIARYASAKGFASLVRQERAVTSLVKSDLDALARLDVLARWQRISANRLQVMESLVSELATEVDAERALAKERRARLEEVLASVSAQQRQASRLVAELSREEKQLDSYVGEMRSAADSGFRSRKGRLPFPASGGLLEVGFGKVVNPRFNTVTVQKGVDIRAKLGAPVLSVAQGTIVYSNWLKGYGNLVIVEHGGGYHSLYAHLAHSEVEVGNEVEEGEEIGVVGDTGSLKGSYLYFEIRRGGIAIDPVPWLQPE